MNTSRFRIHFTPFLSAFPSSSVTDPKGPKRKERSIRAGEEMESYLGHEYWVQEKQRPKERSFSKHSLERLAQTNTHLSHQEPSEGACKLTVEESSGDGAVVSAHSTGSKVGGGVGLDRRDVSCSHLHMCWQSPRQTSSWHVSAPQIMFLCSLLRDRCVITRSQPRNRHMLFSLEGSRNGRK